MTRQTPRCLQPIFHSAGKFSSLLLVLLAANFSTHAGVALRLYYRGITGKSVADLTKHASFPDQPISAEPVIAGLEKLAGSGDRYGTWTRGYLQAPQTGDYVFSIASDDGSELWLSTDYLPVNLKKLAANPEYVKPRNYTLKKAQRSAPVRLARGELYYFELFHKEDTGADHVSVAWQLPDGTSEQPIPATRLLPFAVNNSYKEIEKEPTLLTQYFGRPVSALTNTVAIEGDSLTLSVTVEATPPVTFQWFRNDKLIPDGNLASYTIAKVDLTNDVDSYRVVVSNRLGRAEAECVLSVLSSSNRPSQTASAKLDPQIWYRFEERDASVLSDSSGNNHSATLYGTPMSSDGKNGSCVVFDGKDDYANLSENNLDYSSGFTVLLWARPDAVKSWARFIDFGKGHSNENIVFCRYSQSDDLCFEVYNGNLTGNKIIAPKSIELGVWQHFAATVDQDGHTAIYKNGALLIQGVTAAPKAVVRTNCYIGRSNWEHDQYYQGALDEFAIYNRALTALEIKAAYEGLPRSEEAANSPQTHAASVDPALKLWLKFDEVNSGNTADASGHGHDAIVFGEPELLSDGKDGGCLDFDGVDDYVALPDTTFNVGKGFTMAVWARPTSNAKFARLVDFGNGPSSDNLIFARRFSATAVYFEGFDGDATGGPILAANALETGVWQHLAVTMDKDGLVSIYRNGLLLIAGHSRRIPQSVNRMNNYIGRSNWSADQYYQGAMDDLRLYERVLNADEIRALAEQTSETK